MSNRDLSQLIQLISSKRTLITIDGPVASGKSSVGKDLAKQLNINFLDSGEVYRLLIVFLATKKLNTDQVFSKNSKKWLQEFCTKVSFQNHQIYFDQSPVNFANLHRPQIDQDSKQIVVQKKVRATINKICQQIIAKESFVVVGRDANIAICPFADYKFFLTATVKTRVERKYTFWNEQEKDNDNQNSQSIETKDWSLVKKYVYQRDQNDIKYQIGQIEKINSNWGIKNPSKTNYSLATWERLQLENGVNKIDNSNLTLAQTLDKMITIILSKWKYFPQIAIIGETNVGKSTLFNALAQTKKVLVSSTKLTTRDLYQSRIEINAQTYELIDTGGVDKEKKELNQAILKKLKVVTEKADCLLWVVDPAPISTSAKTILQNCTKNRQQDVILIINKVDRQLNISQSDQFNNLGIKNQITISAKNKRNIENLQKMITNKFNDQEIINPTKPQTIKVVLIGKTNVGKSTLFNGLVDEAMAITLQQAHTTTNTVEKTLLYKKHWFTFFDTGGIRKKERKREITEKKSLTQTVQLINEADVILVVYAVNEKLTTQEKKNIKLVFAAQKPFLIVANKSDLVKTNTKELLEAWEGFMPKLKKTKTPIYLTNAKDIQTKKEAILNLVLKIYLSNPDKNKKIR